MFYCFTFLSPGLTGTDQIKCFNYLLRAQRSPWHNPLSTCLQKISLNVAKISQKKDFQPVQAGCPLFEIKYFPKCLLFSTGERIKKERRKKEKKKTGKVLEIAVTTRIKTTLKTVQPQNLSYLVNCNYSGKLMQYKKKHQKQNKKEQN